MSNNIILNNHTIENLVFNLIEEDKWETFIELIALNTIDINQRDSKGRNALFWAINKSKIDVIEKLITLGIDQNVSTNLTAMNYAVYKDNVKIIKCLKKCGININEKDDINSTPLIYAVLYNRLNSINYLVDNGASLEHKDFMGNSAISLAHDLKIIYLIEKFEAILKQKNR